MAKERSGTTPGGRSYSSTRRGKGEKSTVVMGKKEVTYFKSTTSGKSQKSALGRANPPFTVKKGPTKPAASDSKKVK